MNPFTGRRSSKAGEHWSKIPDFDPDVGDVKAVWELSRMTWLLPIAQRAALGDAGELARINAWLQDWCDHNPPYNGINWKCGQEASIRVMHLAAAAIFLSQETTPQAGLIALVKQHLTRIAPSMAYAIGQQNNHGTSEAAALFIGGSWLAAQGDASGKALADKGRYWLENRALELIEPDGTFSQYSVVYHRLMLETYALAEIWRQRLGLPRFTAALRERLAAASHWLRQLTDPMTGGVPNLGANDGAHLLPIVDAGNRDFRPAVQLCSALFCNVRAFKTPGPWDQMLGWFAVEMPGEIAPELASETMDQGGLHILRNGDASAYLRYPRFRFRPSQSDLLHLDLWAGGTNILRDAGTYSYNSGEADMNYFGGAAAHNTAQFDGRDQMPRLGRFLFGAWPDARQVEMVHKDGNNLAAGAAYQDKWGASHSRHVSLEKHQLVCRDELGGNAETAVIRWRLRPGNWQLDGQTLSDGKVTIVFSSDNSELTAQLSIGFESLHYSEKSQVPVLEISCAVPAVIITKIEF
jgi:hypothetical protein